MRDKRERWIVFNTKQRTKRQRTRLSQLIIVFCFFFVFCCLFVLAFFFLGNCSLCARSCVAACVSCVRVCASFSSMPALLMGCHPGLSQKAASSVGLGINPGIMALMPSWVEAKLFKKYWLPESLSPLFLSPPLSIFCLYLHRLACLWDSALSLSFLSVFHCS